MPNSELMDQDDVYADVQQTQETQATQHSTQQSSQIDNNSNAHLWGFLMPCRDNVIRIDFWKASPKVTIGRGSENDIVLPSLKISNKHCVITWDGKENDNSGVTVLDLSSNGTFINGSKIGRNKTALLKEGNELGIGSWGTQHGTEDYRYIFRFTALGPPRAGLYKFYDVGHELGQGTFATVMRAVSRETGQWYAVKMIQRSRFRAKGPESNQMFLREISILEKLNHPNICRLKETFEDEQSIHIVLEYVDGGDLLDHIVSNGGLGEDHAKLLTVQLCQALAYIHMKGIAHRDLKPENVLLTKGNPPVVKVADFGLAKAVNSMTMFKTTCGTPNYLAPEVILRGPEQGYDHLVDSWSVGVIVFSMLTNASPFLEEDDELDMATRFRNRRIDWDNLIRLGISAEGYSFIQQLLESDPRNRMSLTKALEHPWISHLVIRNTAFRDHSGGPSFASNIVLDGSMVSNGPGNESMVRPPAQAGGNDEMSQGFEKISIEGDSMVPGAFPSSPVGRGRASDKPLNRRVVELNKIDPDGNLQSWELVKPDSEANGKKRKHPNPTCDDSESSLTPVSDEEDGDADPMNAALPAPAAGGRNLRANNIKKRVRGSVSPTRKPRAKARAAAKAAAKGGKRTRAGAARDAAIREDSGADADADMEVENAPPPARARRQSVRVAASPQKRVGVV